MDRKSNTQECRYFGRKLSNHPCNNIEVSQGYVVIGSENDDSIYFHKNKQGECILPNQALRERVKIMCLNDGENKELIRKEWCFDIDLEDVLQFAAQNCRGIYMRVLRENSNIE